MKKLFIIFIFLLLAGLTSCKNSDPLLKKVNEKIDEFITNYASDYFVELDGTLTIEYHVACALSALSQAGYDINLDDYMDKEKVETFYQNLEYSTPVDAFKAIMNSLAFDVSYQKAEEYLATIENTDQWNITYALMALNVTDNNETLKENLLSVITVINEEDYRDADYAGSALMATSNYDIDKTPLLTLINANLSKDGVVAWGNANACSTAYSILGLISSNINPTSDEYTTDGVDLISALLQFEKDGVFTFTLDGEPDLSFSTPQAFSALVAYKLFEETKEPFLLFSDHNQ